MPHNDIRLQDIEMKIAFQERLLEQLNEALTSQQRQLDTIKHKVDHIARLMESTPDQAREPDKYSPPPHY